MAKRMAFSESEKVTVESLPGSPPSSPPVINLPAQKDPPVSDDSTQVDYKKVDIVTSSARNLFKLSSLISIPIIFPRDDVTIDELKVSIVDREFFLVEQVRTFLIQDIRDVILDTNFLFAALNIVSGEFKEEQAMDPLATSRHAYVIKFLGKGAAMRARRIIMGLKIMTMQNENTSKMSVEEVTKKAEELGRAR